MADLKTTGTQLRRGDAASPEVFTSVGQITGVSGVGGGQAREIDVSDLDSTAKEFAQGLPDNGTLTVPLKWDHNLAQHAGVETDRVNQTLRNWQLLYAGHSPDVTASFAAFVQSFSRDSEVDDVYRGTITLRISGAITFA